LGARQQSRRNDKATTEMANIPQKSKDATEEALTAIQEALNMRPPDPRPASGTDSDDRLQSPPNADLFQEDTQARDWITEESAPRRAANDDRASIGQILQALHGRHARLP
jgi:hypothetical protein